MAIRGHKKNKEQHWEEPWPRKQILKHTEGKCPFCPRRCKNLEEHIKSKHLGKKERQIKGIVHGHD